MHEIMSDNPAGCRFDNGAGENLFVLWSHLLAVHQVGDAKLDIYFFGGWHVEITGAKLDELGELLRRQKVSRVAPGQEVATVTWESS